MLVSFVTGMPYVEEELLTLQDDLSSHPVFVGFVFFDV
jgi:hypothetical protein